jgi:transposase
MNEIIEKQALEIERLQEEVAHLRRLLFGKKKETLDIDQSELLPYFNDVMKKLEESQKEIIKEKVSYEREKTKRKSFKHFEMPEDAEREIVIHDLPEDEKVDPITGEVLEFIGEDVREQLKYVPGYYKVLEIHIKKYALPNKAKVGIIAPQLPEEAIKGCRAHVSLLTHILVSKFADHLPLYRIEEQFKRTGLNISRQTLSSWVLKLGDALMPLGDALRDQILAQNRIFTDDSPIKFQIKGKKKIQEGRIWTYCGGDGPDPPLVWFEFTKDRSHSHTIERMKNFQGVFHADAFGAYEKLDKQDGILWQACWAHARRKFNDVLKPNELCKSILLMMDELFRLEKEAWQLNSIQRLKLRQDKSKELVSAIFDACEQLIWSGELVKGKLDTAVHYLFKRKAQFSRFLEHSEVRIDNNVSERSIRPLTIGRKNWLFFGSEKGGQAAATVLSMIQTCRNLGINPSEYMEDVLMKIKNTDDLEALHPQNWKK